MSDKGAQRIRFGKAGKVSVIAAVLAVTAATASVATGCSSGNSGPGETASSDLAVSGDLVISQLYGGGGNTGAPFKNDFVELFNRGRDPVSLAGKSLQYASSGAAFSAASSVALPNATIAPGKYYLVQLAGGATGASLPIADHVGELNLAKDKGKVALVLSSALLDACGTTASPCSPDAYIDFVGYGAASQSEGDAAGAPSNTTSAIRRAGGCKDTGDNGADFEVGTPSPRNSSSPSTSCNDDAGTPDSGSDSGARPDASGPDASGRDASGPDASGVTKDAVLLNEVKINPPTDQDAPWEYAEISCKAGVSLAGYYFVALEGDGDSSTGSPGVADIVVDLGGASCGANGLVYIKAASGGTAPQAPQTTVVTSAALDTGKSPFENATTSFVIIKSLTTPITQGTDYDAANDGNLALPAGALIVDGVSVFEQSDGVTDYTYAPRITLAAGSPDAVTRLADSKAALSAAAWYGGDLTGATADSLEYDATRATANLPANAMLTPGGANFAARGPSTKPTPEENPGPSGEGEEEESPSANGESGGGGGKRYQNPTAPASKSDSGCSTSGGPGAGGSGAIFAAIALVLASKRRRARG